MNDKEFENYTLTLEDLDFIDGGAITSTEGETPGMKCPQCGGFIPTTIMQIITTQAIVCPHCHLRLNIDRMKSSKAIEALKKVQAAQDKASRK